MRFQERSYAGKIFRPKPEIYHSENEKVLAVGTPWGNPAGAKRAVETLVDYFVSNLGDSEATSPFRRLPQLSAIGNNLRIGLLLANDHIYTSENRNEYRNGVEFFAAAFDQKEMVWLQVGSPHVLLKRKGRPLLLLSASMDLSMELSPPERVLPPLPGDMIGLDANPHILVNSFRPAPEDKLILISRSWLPQTLYSLDDFQMNIEEISLVLADEEQDLPYWLGIWHI